MLSTNFFSGITQDQIIVVEKEDYIHAVENLTPSVTEGELKRYEQLKQQFTMTSNGGNTVLDAQWEEWIYRVTSWQNVNPFPNKPWFLRVFSTSLLKTLWEKEKLLMTSNFSFSPSVFYLKTRWEKEKLLTTKTLWEITVGKREIAHYISPFPTVFSTCWRAVCHFHKILNCRMQTVSIWKSLNFVIWERVKLVKNENTCRQQNKRE